MYRVPFVEERKMDVPGKKDAHLSVLQRMAFAEKMAKLGYWELDTKAKRFYWSAEMYRIFGIPEERNDGKKNLFRDYILPEDLPIYKERLIDLLRHHKPVAGEIRIRRISGQIVYCKFTAGINGRRIAGTFQNISSWVRQRQLMKEAREKAENANREKTWFLAQASHDLRQPLQALQLFTHALQSSDPTPEQMPIIQKIDASVDNFRTLLDNLLDISRADSRQILPKTESFNLSELLSALCDEYKIVAAQKNIDIRCRFSSVWILSDRFLLERILRNLLSNAVKYTKRRIILSCRENEKHIIIRVIDDGIGIRQEEIERVFDEFYQSSAIPENRSHGAGLGLSIVKKLTTMLQGKISVRSTPGEYTVFNLYLPHKI